MGKILTEKEAEHIAGVIAELEQKTDGEIRLMIVSRSSRTGHVMFSLWMALTVVSLLALWILHVEGIFSGGWYVWEFVFGAFLVALLLARLPGIQRGFTPFADLRHAVWARAEVEFHREGLSDTENRTGVLIFLSLLERQAVVLADKGISDKVKPGTWDKVIQTVVQGAHSRQWAKQLEAAVRECGAYLAEHFPARAENRNELPNSVIMKD